MTIHLMDVFYIGMIAIIFGYIIHLETQMKVVLEMMKAKEQYKTCLQELEELENQLDK